MLGDRLVKEKMEYLYVSPLGRARDTASCTLRRLGRTAEVLPWLREFEAPIRRPDVPEKKMIPWDWLPGDWTREERFYRYDHWFEAPAMAEGKVKEPTTG